MSINIPPIKPINNLGSSFSSSGVFGGAKLTNNGLNRIRPVGDRTKTAFEKIDIGKIGKGYLLVEGTYEKQFGREKYSGLKGQLMSMRKAGSRSVTKNLSKKNIKQIHDMLASRLGKKAVGSQNFISREDRLAIMKESEELVSDKKNKFTEQDREDLLKTVDALREQYKNRILNRDTSSLDKPIDEPEPPIGVFQPNSLEHSTGVFKNPSSKPPKSPTNFKLVI